MRHVSKLATAEEIWLETARQKVLTMQWNRRRSMLLTFAGLGALAAGVGDDLPAVLAWILRLL